jgi:phage terminase large subunit GpA-like protein
MWKAESSPVLIAYRVISAMLAPPPDLLPSQWAHEHAWLPREGNAEPGKYRKDRLPYQREMLDDARDETVTESYWCIGSQLGKTLCLILITEYFIDQQPAPILAVYPTLDSAKSWAREKFTPTVNATPRLDGKIRDPRSRDSENTTLNKKFPGGNITVCGANSPSGLRQRSKRIILLDEIDAYEPNAEGDPIEQATKRAETFQDAVKILSSTPTVKGASRIEQGFLSGDQQRWHVPCPKCGGWQWLKWGQLKWTFTGADGKEESRPRDAVYICESCKAEWTDQDRIRAIHAGEWRALAPFRGVRSRQLSGLYRILGKKRAFSSFLHEFVDGFLKAKAAGKLSLMVWVNTFLAETWEDEAQKIETTALMKRRENYGPEIPQGVILLTLSCDVQGDRIEAELTGWGEGEESWGISYHTFPGNPLQPTVWASLDQFRQKKWRRVDGVEMRITCTVVDAGAYSDEVYRYCKPRFADRVFAVRGIATSGAPIASARPSRGNRLRCPLFPVGVDMAKSTIYGRLQLAEHGPGFMHYPSAEQFGFNDTYFSMLTAEEVRTQYVKGFPKRVWHKTRPRNEALDIRAYALAAIGILQPDWGHLKRRLDNGRSVTTTRATVKADVALEPEIPNVKKPDPTARLRRSGGFARPRGGWSVSNW